MNSKTVLVLGGYGGVGRSISRLLLRETEAELIIAGRRKTLADEFAARLREESSSDRISSRHADASDFHSLVEAFRGVGLVIVLVPAPELAGRIGLAALAAGCDYLDILVSESTVSRLGELATSILEQRRVFITQAGFHPGLPAVFTRHGARFFDQYERATIAMAMNARFERPEQTAEIISLVSDVTEICRDGVWRKATYRDAVRFDMGSRFGAIMLYPIQMAEMKLMQKKFNLRDTGVYVSGFNWFVDNLVLPLILVTQNIRKGLAVRLLERVFTWGVNTFSSPNPGVVFMNDAEGWKDGKRIGVRIVAEHDDPYLFTAIPVVACVKQYFAGRLPPGLSMMGHAVDEDVLFRDMERMGVKIRTEKLAVSQIMQR